MTVETFAKTKIGKPVIRLLASVMESRLRYRLFGPDKILQGVDNLKGKAVLEIGCGTGFFTIPAARLTGNDGTLAAMDILSESVEEVSRKLQAAGLNNVKVCKGDVLDTKLENESFDTVLLLVLFLRRCCPYRAY